MKKLLILAFGLLGISSNSFAVKYICSQNNMDDSIYTSVFKTSAECNKYCTGIGSVCEPTGDETVVDTTDSWE